MSEAVSNSGVRIVRGSQVLVPDGLRAATIVVRDGRIVRVEDHEHRVTGAPVLDAGELVVLPGLVDTHVHVNEPGRTHWEGFATATRAAAAGGVTTLVDMPLNSIPATTTAAGFAQKLSAAAGQCHVDVGFWGGVVPGNTSELEPLVRRGVLGFKCFLAPSGVDEFEHVDEHDLRTALPVLARLGVPLLVHAESPSLLLPADPTADRRSHRTWLDTRPAAAEEAAVDLLISLSREFGVHIHVVHLAAGSALATLRRARMAGVTMTVETCPHYLTFASGDIPDGATQYKCAPPIRSAQDRERLWQALNSGDIDLVATDHSPAPAAMKHVHDGDFLAAWGGIATLQLGSSVLWTGARARGMRLEQLAQWMCRAPADLAGLANKGSIAAGRDADLVFWDPDAESIVDPGSLEHRHPVTPYGGMRLKGRVHKTLLRGEIVYDEGRFAPTPLGRSLIGRTANIPQR